jgi:hypothetical protein
MGTLQPPDWTEMMGTGVWGLGYRLRANQGLVLLSNAATLPCEKPDRLWPFVLTRNHLRNKALEQSVEKQEKVCPFLEHLLLGKDDLLCVREKNLNELLSLLGREPAQDGSPG